MDTVYIHFSDMLLNKHIEHILPTCTDTICHHFVFQDKHLAIMHLPEVFTPDHRLLSDCQQWQEGENKMSSEERGVTSKEGEKSTAQRAS